MISPSDITFKSSHTSFKGLRGRILLVKWLASHYKIFWGRGDHVDTWNFKREV